MRKPPPLPQQVLKIWQPGNVQGACSLERGAWPLLPMPLSPEATLGVSAYSPSQSVCVCVGGGVLLPTPCETSKGWQLLCSSWEPKMKGGKAFTPLVLLAQGQSGVSLIRGSLGHISLLIMSLNCTGLGSECVCACVCERVCAL